MKNTLKQNYEFRRLYHRGKSSASRHVVLYARRNGRPINRTGLTVTPKLGKAVVRRRGQRRLRAARRELAPQKRPGGGVVLVARNACTAAKTAEVTASLRKAARGVGLLKEGGAK